jgi:uncharacterized membrane protein (UPF0127 family)
MSRTTALASPLSARLSSKISSGPPSGLTPLLASLLVLSVALVALSACSRATTVESPEPDAWVTIGRARVATEVVRDFAAKARGLGGRDSLAWDHGMLFPYERADFLAFWMKDMRFSIDIVWIREGRIVDIAHRVPFDPSGGPGPTVRPRELADAVLEVPAGYAQAMGWRIGDGVEVDETQRR